MTDLTPAAVMESYREMLAENGLVENKSTVARFIGYLLATTRQYSDLESCEYIKDDRGDEWVVLTGLPNETGYRWKYKCNVTWDSGIAMIRDVLKQIS